jgi:hypothetical protein
MGAARESTSKGARSVTAVTVAGHESVIQKNLQAEERAYDEAQTGGNEEGNSL